MKRISIKVLPMVALSSSNFTKLQGQCKVSASSTRKPKIQIPFLFILSSAWFNNIPVLFEEDMTVNLNRVAKIDVVPTAKPLYS